jgi:hypothetical protein
MACEFWPNISANSRETGRKLAKKWESSAPRRRLARWTCRAALRGGQPATRRKINQNQRKLATKEAKVGENETKDDQKWPKNGRKNRFVAYL